MDADRNLLFGVLALQGDFINADQFAEACTAWSGRKGSTLADLLVERGWITPDDRAHVEYFLERKLRKHGGDAHASLAEAADDRVKGMLDGLDDPDVRRTVDTLPKPEGHVLLSTIGYTPESRERYALTRLHAKGGLGQVWLARDTDLGREVALKELRPERAANPSVWSRFLEEARITGQLEHPNIVPVHELVRPGEGRQPFYTMRFVKGRTLSEAIKGYHRSRQAGAASPLDFQGLLTAFVGVCNAVAYAHSRGVVHRDLKGQNVVLGDYGEVIVLDWGLAKLVDRPEETLTPPVAVAHEEGRGETAAGQALGTPAYMAPEQAEGRSEQIDRRTDVYGLGAILYEILAGRPPFDGSNTAEVLRRVVAEPPERPRAVCGAAPAALEAVCLQALAKRPEDRYDTAHDLAQEVRRWLADEPVRAYPEPWPKRAGRWARRHRPLVAAAAALLVTAVVGLSVSTVLINRERARAEASFRQARAAVDEYFTTVSESKLLDVPGLQPLRKELLESALRYYQGFLRQRGGDPTVRAETAATYYRVAIITQLIGSKDAARAAFSKALALYEELVRDRPEVVKFRTDLAICCNDLGNLLRGAGRPDEAMRIHRKALALRQDLARAHPGGARFQNELAKSHGNLGDLLIESGRAAEALDSYEKARAINEALVRARPAAIEFPSDLGRRYNTSDTFRLDLAIDHDMIGYLRERFGQRAEALRSRQRAVAILEGLVRDHPADTDYRSRLAGSYNGIGYMLSRDDQPDRAIAFYEKARAHVETLAADNPSVTNFQSQLAGTYNNLARLFREQGRTDEAARFYRRALEIQEKVVRDHPDVVGYQSTLAYIHRGIGRLHAQAGRVAEALEAFGKARAIDERLAGKYPLARYDLACDLALCIPLVGRGAGEPTDRELGDAAVATLRQAIADGYRNLSLIETDPDLDPIRSRDDFKALLKSLKARDGRSGPVAVAGP